MSYEKLVAIKNTHLNLVNSSRSKVLYTNYMHLAFIQSMAAGPVFLMLTYKCSNGACYNHKNCEVTSDCSEFIDDKQKWEDLCKYRIDEVIGKHVLPNFIGRDFVMVLPKDFNFMKLDSLLDHRIIFPYSVKTGFTNPHCWRYLEAYGAEGISGEFRMSGYPSVMEAIGSLGFNRATSYEKLIEYVELLEEEI